MKKQVLSLGFLAFTSLAGLGQVVTETVSIGAGYANQKWYSLQNGELGTQSKDNWDIAFEITGYSSAILANTQKPNFAVYLAPYSIDDYALVDSAGISNWPALYNSDTSWAVGAFNKGANPSNPMDLGWGVYNMSTHIVSGDSCYVVKLAGGAYKKLKIESLAGGVYTFEFADLNGSNSHTQTISKSAYSGKNFVYFDLGSNSIVDREPLSSTWDLTFGRYTALLTPTSPYAVVGVLSNKGVSVMQANNVTAPASYTNFGSGSFNTNISCIGHDWKSFDLNSNAWVLVNDTLYFVSDKSGAIWKLRFTSFGGSSNGNFVFTKEKMETGVVGLPDGDKSSPLHFSVFPNPAAAEKMKVLLVSNEHERVEIRLLDVQGTRLFNQIIEVHTGMQVYDNLFNNLPQGVYFVEVNAGTYSSVKKIIIH